MNMWNLSMTHGMSGTVENLGAYLRHALDDVMAGQVEYLAVDHGAVKRTGPGIGNSPTKIVTNFSFKDRHAIHFTATKIESDDQPQADATNLNTWAELVEESERACMPQTLAQILAAQPRPAWSDKSYDQMGSVAAGCTFNSTPVSVPLSRHLSEVLNTGKMLSSRAEVSVRQALNDAAPMIGLNRWSRVGTKTQIVKGSPFLLAIDEAAELARALLLAVEVAREGEATP